MSALQQIARALRGDIAGRDLVLAPGPGHSSRDRSLSISFDPQAPDGFLVHSFANDDWEVCRDHVRDVLGLGRFESRNLGLPATYVAAPPDAAAVGRRDRALKRWHEARPIGGTVAERYLAGRRVHVDEALTGEAIRFHSACPFRLESSETVRLPAMIALMRDIRTNELTGIHRTALQSDGNGKANIAGLGNPKKMLGTAAGACVKLCGDGDVTSGLHVAEGIETALAVISLGFRPTWALLSAGGIGRFPALAGIQALTIFADNDVSGTGERAALDCSTRWQAAGAEVVAYRSPVVGRDFADEVAS